ALDHGLVVRRRGGLHLRQHLAVARVDRLEHAGAGGLRPLAVAEVGTGFVFSQAEGGEDGMGHWTTPAGEWLGPAARTCRACRRALPAAAVPGSCGCVDWRPRHDSNVRPTP